MIEAVLEQLSDSPSKQDTLPLRDMEKDIDGTTRNGLDRVAQFTADSLIVLRENSKFVPGIVAREQFTANSDGTDSETFDLGHGLIDSGHLSSSITVFIDNGVSVSQVRPESVDYQTGTVTLSAPADADVIVFYASSDQGRMLLRKVSEQGLVTDIIELDPGLVHRRNKLSDPIHLAFERPLEPVVPKHFSIEIVCDVPYTPALTYSGSGTAVAPNPVIQTPFYRVFGEIEGAKAAVRRSMSEG
jgi:hypothetical protein